MAHIRIAWEDRDNAIRNMLTIFGGGNVQYNAVLNTEFSDEAEDEPVTLAEAKAWCRIDGDSDDTLIEETIIPAAREMCEDYANLSFIERTVTARVRNGLGGIILPYGPVGTINSYLDDEGDAVTDYELKDAYGTELTIEYTAGYETLPKRLKTALLNQIAWMYDNRGDLQLQSQLSDASKLILNQVRKTN